MSDRDELVATILRVIQRTADKQGSVTMLRLAENIANDPASVRMAQEAEFHVEQLRDALDSAERRIERAERLIDSWEHDAPDHSNPVFIGRLRECLRRDPASVRLRGEQCDCAGRLIETNAHEDTCPVEQERWSNSDYVATWEEAHPCAHDWLDRPESDTRECLICGAEVSG